METLFLLIVALTGILMALVALEALKRLAGRKAPKREVPGVELLRSLEQSSVFFAQALEKTKKLILESELAESSLMGKFKAQADLVDSYYQKEIEKTAEGVTKRIEEGSRRLENDYRSFLKSQSENIDQKTEALFVSAQASVDLLLSKIQSQTEALKLPFDEIKNNLNEKINGLEDSYADFIKDLELKAAGGFEENQKNLSLIEEKIKADAVAAEKSYSAFMKTLEERLDVDFRTKEKALELKTEAFFNKSQELLNNFIVELQGRTEKQLDQEIGSSKKIIEEYRRQRLEIIDEDIVGILEKTLNITLGKKLALNEQTQLIYEALEEAKKENFFT